MDSTTLRAIGFAIVAIGFLLSLMIAVVPHYVYGHRLELDLLIMGLLPYSAYAAFLPFLRGIVLLVPGVVILGLQAGMALPLRWAMQQPPVPAQLYEVSVWALLISLPLSLLSLWVSRKKLHQVTSQ